MSIVSPLEINHLVKVYGSITAVDDVSLKMNPGEIFGLLGPNGAGKTSLISVIMTLEEATSGIVKLFGKTVERGNRESKLNVGLVPQEIVSHGFFSVQEILEFYSGYHGLRNNRDQINYLLDRLSLTAHKDKRVRQLSGGMKRRLLIAKALVHRPNLLLLDEPTAGVDVELRASLWKFFRELHAGGVSILLTTHYLEEAESLCDRVGILHHGKLLKVGQTRELVKTLTLKAVTIEFSNEKEIHHEWLVSKKGNVVELRVPSDLPWGDLLKKIGVQPSDVRDVKIHEGSLEEAFVNVVSR